jgi:hypothetical protein
MRRCIIIDDEKLGVDLMEKILLLPGMMRMLYWWTNRLGHRSHNRFGCRAHLVVQKSPQNFRPTGTSRDL